MDRPEAAPKIVPRAEQRRDERGAARQSFEPEMILIPGGEFLMGSDPRQDTDAFPDERPQHHLSLPNYFLARTPVTQAQYREFVQATGHRAPEGWTNGNPSPHKEDHPVADVSLFDAKEYCQWLSQVTGKDYRLPSEAEWEKGARGTDGRIYPWGSQWDFTRCNSSEGGVRQTTLVQAYPQGTSPYDVLDMAGNIWEWTRSLWGGSGGYAHYRYPYRLPDTKENPEAGGDVSRVLRGGAFYCDRRDVRCARRSWYLPFGRNGSIGFRVVMHPAS
jgi:formylglycine-generating enzyme required for sulfatase activity